jgi:hypothetical protein
LAKRRLKIVLSAHAKFEIQKYLKYFHGNSGTGSANAKFEIE